MTLLCEKGTFTKTTSTGVPVSQQVTLSNSSLTPKIIILWTSGQTTSNGTYTDHTLWSYGWSDGTNDVCQATRCHETNENEAYVIRNDSIISILSLTAGSEVSRADISAVAAGSFTLNWSTQSDTTAMAIHYEVIGGTDITNVSAFTGTHINFSTGNHSWNGSGTTFTPEFALIMNSSDNAVVVNTISSAATKNVFGLGAVTGTSTQWGSCHRVATATTSNTAMLFDPAACLVALNSSSEAAAWVGNFVSFNNSAGGGITLNITNAAGNTGVTGFLLVKGGKWDVEAFQQKSGTGTQDVTLTDSTVTAKMVNLVGVGTATATTGQVHDYYCIGGSDGTNEGNCYAGNTDALPNYQTARSTDTGKVYRMATAPNATASSTSTTAECDMSSMSTAGQFTLDWTTADSTQRQMGFFMVGEVIAGTTFNRSPTAEDVTISEVSLNRIVSAARTPSTDSTTVAESSLTRMLSAVRVPGSDSTTVVDSSLTRSKTWSRVPTADTTVVTESSTTRMLSARRLPATENITLNDSGLTRMLSATRVPSSDSITTSENLSGGKVIVRVPSSDSVTVADSSLTRLLSALRLPSSDSITTGENLIRILSAMRSPSTDSVTAQDSSTTQKMTRVRVPTADTTTVTDSSVTRMLSATRVPSSDSITVLDSSLTRILSLLRVPSSDSVTTSENVSAQKSQGAQTFERSPVADTIAVVDAALTRILSALRLPGTETITVTDSSLTRMLSLSRSPSSDSVTALDNTPTRIISRTRAPTADSTTVSDSSLTRMLSALRVPTADTITASDSSLIRRLSAIRIPSTEVVGTSESIGAQVSGRVSRSVEDTVIVSENLSRLLQLRRVPTADTVNLNEQLSRIITRNRVPSSDSISVSDAALVRMVTNIRSLSETPAVVEASLSRILSAARSLSDTTIVSELQSQLSLSRRLEETVSVTEPVIQRIVTAIRTVTPDIVDVDEQVFFQTFHKFVFDSVAVAESLFSIRQSLSGSVTYATPAEVRPLLGNIGAQRTDVQITTAIDSAYDEINRRTGRQPPNDWKDTENDFGIVKKICRFKAALEMAVGIKDFEDREWMQKEIEEMFKIIEEGEGESGTTSTDIVGSSPDTTYALNPQGIIWSIRYPNLKKASSSGENDTTINPNT